MSDCQVNLQENTEVHWGSQLFIIFICEKESFFGKVTREDSKTTASYQISITDVNMIFYY